MAEHIEWEAALALVRPDAPEDEKSAVTIATAKKLVRDIVHRSPADVASAVHGRWIEYQIPHVICCSNCDWATDPAEKNLQDCPMCGAKMGGE